MTLPDEVVRAVEKELLYEFSDAVGANVDPWLWPEKANSVTKAALAALFSEEELDALIDLIERYGYGYGMLKGTGSKLQALRSPVSDFPPA